MTVTKDDAHRLWPVLERLKKPSSFTHDTVPTMERWLAAAADKICSNPNENIDWMQAIWAICDNSAKVDKRLSRRAVLTGVAVMKDIIPAYKSTGVGVQKTNKKLSKQAEEILTYDTKLVDAYQNLLARLKTMKEIRGMCALLTCASLWTFNDFDRLLAMVVSSAGSGDTTAINTIEEVLKDDAAVEVATKKIVIMIGKVKSPQQLVHLAPLLKLARTDTSNNIIEETHNVAIKLASGEEDTDINRDLDAGFAGLNKERVRKAEAVVLAEVLVVYLRVLRTSHLYPKEVIVECLKGVGEKADAANLELVIEIAHELRDFFAEQLSSGSDNGPLLAAHAALALLKLAGSSAGKAIGEPMSSAHTYNVALEASELSGENQTYILTLTQGIGVNRGPTVLSSQPVQAALATCLESLPKLLRLLLSQEDATGLLEGLCRGVMGVDATLGGSKNAAPWMAKAMGEALVTTPFGRDPAHTLLEIFTKFGSVRGCLDEEGMIVGLDYTHPVCLYWTAIAAGFHYDPECSKVIVPQFKRFSRDLDRSSGSQASGTISVKRMEANTGENEENNDEVSASLEDCWLWSDAIRSKRQRLTVTTTTSSTTALKNAALRFQPVTNPKDWQNRLPSL